MGVFDAFDGAEGVGEVADGAGGASEDDDFEAVVVVEVDVEGGDDEVAVFVLDVVDLVAELAGVVVVDHGEGGGDVLGGVAPFLGDEGFADEVAQGLGAVGVAFAFVALVEGGEEFGGHGDGVAFEVGHGRVGSGVEWWWGSWCASRRAGANKICEWGWGGVAWRGGAWGGACV